MPSTGRAERLGNPSRSLARQSAQLRAARAAHAPSLAQQHGCTQQRRVAPPPRERARRRFSRRGQATSARAQRPRFAEPGPAASGGACKRLSPPTTLLEAQSGCARAVERRVVRSRRARPRAGRAAEAFFAGRHGARTLARPPALRRQPATTPRNGSPPAELVSPTTRQHRNAPRASATSLPGSSPRSCWGSCAVVGCPRPPWQGLTVPLCSHPRQRWRGLGASVMARRGTGARALDKVTRRCCERRGRQGRANAASLAPRRGLGGARTRLKRGSTSLDRVEDPRRVASVKHELAAPGWCRCHKTKLVRRHPQAGNVERPVSRGESRCPEAVGTLSGKS